MALIWNCTGTNRKGKVSEGSAKEKKSSGSRGNGTALICVATEKHRLVLHRNGIALVGTEKKRISNAGRRKGEAKRCSDA